MKLILISLGVSILFCSMLLATDSNKETAIAEIVNQYTSDTTDLVAVVFLELSECSKCFSNTQSLIEEISKADILFFDKKGVMIWDMDPNCPGPKIQVVPKLPSPTDSTMQIKSPKFNPPNPKDLEIRL